MIMGNKVLCSQVRMSGLFLAPKGRTHIQGVFAVEFIPLCMLQEIPVHPALHVWLYSILLGQEVPV